MKVKVLKEAGFEEALLGLSLSYNSEPSKRVADNLAWKGKGESKFLESICVWIDIDAPRYFHQQLDTYRVGITKQSSSTMHTLMRRELDQLDFQGGCDDTILETLNCYLRNGDFGFVKRHLPESFLQRRVVCTNYKTLQNICMQRKNHRLPEWQVFIGAMQEQLEHPYYVVRPE